MTDLPVVVIGAGPQGLAAAAHLMERGDVPAGAGGRRRSGCCGGGVGACAAVLGVAGAGGRGGGPAARADGLDRAGVRATRRAGSGSSSIWHRWRASWGTGSATALGWRGIPAGPGPAGLGRPGGVSRSPCMCSTGRGESRLEARAVVDASGTWRQPNPAGADGCRRWGSAPQPPPGVLTYLPPTPSRGRRRSPAGTSWWWAAAIRR